MKDDPIDSLLDHDEDVPVPEEHEERIRRGLGPLLVATSTVVATSAVTSTTSTATKAAGKAALGKWLAVVALAAGGSGFVAGRVSAPRLADPAPPPTSALPTPVTTPKPTAIESSTTIVELPASPASNAPSSSASPNKPASSENAFDREQSLLERARSALVRHDAAAAEAALDEAEKLFPRSRHAEERDYLRIQTLREKGDLAGARVRARIFLVNYPDSMLKRRIEAITTEGAPTP